MGARVALALCLALGLAGAAQRADFLGEATTGVTCEPHQFRCADGSRCIPAHWRCDRRADCDDNSDERIECDLNTTCLEGQFRCNVTGHCIPSGWKCDGDFDCGLNDKSDENPFSCEKGFHCPGNQARCAGMDSDASFQCVATELFCNGVGNCPDNSDEWDICKNKTACNAVKCAHGCRPTLDGAACFCRPGQEPKGDTCVDTDECLLEGTCDQSCSNTNGSFLCSCVSGYQLSPDGHTCKATNEPRNLPGSLIVITHSDIRRLTLAGRKWHGNATVAALNVQALDIDYSAGLICYIHNNLTKSSLICIDADDFSNRTVMPSPAMFPQINSISQLALDWVSGNWYFVDEAREVVFICDHSLTHACRILLDSNVSKVKGIALDPTKGYMFWTVWGMTAPAVSRANLDGTSRSNIVNVKLVYPQGITLDIPNSKVYWSETYLDYIERVNYDGGNRVTVKRGYMAQNLNRLSIFESWVWAPLWGNKTVLKFSPRGETTQLQLDGAAHTMAVMVYHRQKQPLVPHPCQKNNGGCAQLCITAYRNGTAHANCICRHGYRVLGRRECVRVQESSFLLISKASPAMVKSASVHGSRPHDHGQWEAAVPIMDVSSPTAIDYDVSTGYIYYSDVQRYEIARQKLDGSGHEVFISTDIDNCEGLAVDWLGRNLYWTDDAVGQISVARLDNSTIRKVLVQGAKFNPRSIALDPARGMMYWSDWASSTHELGSIESAHMDGTSRKVLAKQGVHWANGLTIDFDAHRLYWCDAYLNKIEYMGLDGAGRKVLVSESATVKIIKPYGLAIFEGTVFWSEHTTGEIKRWINDTTIQHFRTENTPLLELKLYDSALQGGSNECSAPREGGPRCSELCLATPAGRTCACSLGHESVNGSCRAITNYKPPARCPPDHFHCGRGHCIVLKYVCDGDSDCPNRSDEDRAEGGICANVSCPDTHFRCDGNRCIASGWVCDGIKDCKDGRDEEPEMCVSETCNTEQFSCVHSGRCVPAAWLCDGVADCGPNDDSDERHNCEYSECQSIAFTCDNGDCVPLEHYCDGHDDCRDGSDEKSCNESCSDNSQIYCAPQGICLLSTLRCDGTQDCPDGSDEANCSADNSRTYANNQHHGIHEGVGAGCEDHEFQCRNKECIRKEFRCDSRVDCLDGSDEANCSSTVIHRATTAAPRTTTQQPDATVACEKPLFSCDNGTRCVHLSEVCDGRRDCGDGTDEGGRCLDPVCEMTDCSHTCAVTPDGPVCVCPSPLYLQADQVTCLEQHPCTAWGVCSQTCSPLKYKHKCTCYDGYRLADDGFTCKSTDRATPLVIFSNRNELRSVELPSLQSKSLISSLKNTIALDFHWTGDGNHLYWTDVIDDKIYKGSIISGSLSKIEVVVQTGLSTAEGLAVDWIGENLYWVESNLDQIEVAKLNGSFRRTLVGGDMESPRAIALDPRDGLLFWSDWEQTAPRIERCTLAGNRRQIVVKVDELTDGAWPNGLTLDYAVKRIYWIDARSDSVHTTLYDGSDYHEVIRGHETLSHPFAITLFESHVYWTDWRSNSVVRATKWNGTDVTVVLRTLTQPFDIKIVHPNRQPRSGKNPCGGNNGGCSHLCLLDGPDTRMCACPHVMRLAADNKTCEVHEKVLLISRNIEIRGVDLEQPYHLTIPTLRMPQVVAAQTIQFVANTGTLYWADTQINEIKKTGLTKGPVQTIIDTGVENPYGFAVDWLARLMFFSSSGKRDRLSVCNLDGEYTTVIYDGDAVCNVTSLAVDPIRGKMYFSHTSNRQIVIEQANMNGNARRTLTSQDKDFALIGVTSLSMDVEANRLYWVNQESGTMQYYDFSIDKVRNLHLPMGAKPTAIVAYGLKVYYADSIEGTISTCDKNACANNTLLRNNTGNVLSLRVYDAALQRGGNGGACALRKTNCSHLCLPVSERDSECVCATGYHQSPETGRCEGVPELLLYSINWEIRGLSLDGDNTSTVLGPISQVSMATSIDFDADKDYLYWADSDHGTVSRIRRDGTGRQTVVEQLEPMDTLPFDWLSGLAVDWVAANMYWTDPRRNVIEVARLNGSSRYVVIANDATPTAIAVDPMGGWLWYAGYGWIKRSRLDGSHATLLYNQTGPYSVTDLALDTTAKLVYWTDGWNKSLMRMAYDGSRLETLLTTGIQNPAAVAVYNRMLYWADTVHEGGSIKMAPVNNVTNFTVLIRNVGDSLKDIQIFSARSQGGTNACGRNNGGCAELCLFNGTAPVCACPHGDLAPDGKSCVPYNSFLMYSRVTKIDSIHMFDKTDLNAPYASIQHKDLMRNAIGLTYDYKRSRLFYSDIQRGSINSVYFNGTNLTVFIDQQGAVEGLAYEPITNTLFWTCNNEATVNRVNVNAVEVSLASGARSVTHLVSRVVKLSSGDRPRGIDVDSCDMRVYWTNWNSHKPSIQRARANGFDHESIITTDILMPNGLALDHKAKKLYWADARLDKIERTEYDGSRRVILSQSITHHPFDLCVYGDFIFWTDWVLHAVMRANKHTGLEVTRLRRDVPRPMGIVAVAADRSTCAFDPCAVLNGFCSEICTLSSYGNVSCECEPPRVLQADGKRCAVPILNTPAECDSSHFRCSEGSCIPYELTCDGIPHCSDLLQASDEDPFYCSSRVCPLEFFTCAVGGRCVPVAAVCDGRDDCDDGGDEADCNCTADHFRCGNGLCIPITKRCDRSPDCTDLSDELSCPRTDCRALQPRQINCATTTDCYLPDWRCDNNMDCMDGSDEANCTISATDTVRHRLACGPDTVTCPSGLCIMPEWRCDGHDDCKDGSPPSDEVNCLTDNDAKQNVSVGCREDQFTCGRNESDAAKTFYVECIQLSWECDGHVDCIDGSDETLHCSAGPCSEGSFRCESTGVCLSEMEVCDGVSHCARGEDEAGCACPQPHTFQCADSRQCIDRAHYCDGDSDCTDGSDEPPGCAPPSPPGGATIDSTLRARTTCGAGGVACNTGRCVPREQICDGRDHCADGGGGGAGTDEDPTACTSYARALGSPKDASGLAQQSACASGEWTCANGACVSFSQLCDGIDHCGDYSDEQRCNVNECLNRYACGHNCTDLPVGYACWCRVGYRLAVDRSVCIDVDECLEDEPCDHICRNTIGSYACSCHKDYSLTPDGVTCTPNSNVQASLIFTNRYYVRRVELQPHSATSLLVHNLTNAVALDFDWRSRCLYWSDVTRLGSSIKRVCNVSYETGAKHNNTYQLLHSSTLQNPDGLAVDWVAGNLYWCDKGTDTIEVSKLDGRHRKVLIRGGLQEPRAIALNPQKGYMYWSDWGDRPHIGRAGMDGCCRSIIISEGLGWPNALTISHDTQELYFADAREDFIAVSDFKGENIRKLFSRDRQPTLNLHHIFAIAVWEGQVYWSDWETKSIESCRRRPLPPGHPHLQIGDNSTLSHGGLDCHTITPTVHKPMDLRVYHPFRQKPIPELEEACAALNCSGLCLLTPNPTAPARCECPEHFVLASDGRSCRPNCTTAHFVCADTLKCIPFWWRCDTQDDCGDGSDEPASCPPFRCSPGQFQCDNARCIHPSQICDGQTQCGDNSDERDCDMFTCLSTQYKCEGNASANATALCISENLRCDGTRNCINGDDEKNCPPKTCTHTHFQCANGQCVPLVWVCDQDDDCGDNSDESHNCTSRQCKEEDFRCSSGRCVPQPWVCDGEIDCSDREDEMDCGAQTELTCEPTYFKCPNNKCIPGRWRCDYDDDCGDRADEVNCTPRNCSESEFRCANGQCIRGALHCNNAPDCSDETDEVGCETTCGPNQFRCRDPPQCIPLSWQCDGDSECGDGSDEIGCGAIGKPLPSTTCPRPEQFRCASGACLHPAWRCDGYVDCPDRADEDVAMCARTACEPPLFRCKNKICIPPQLMCDGEDHCGDKSDEIPYMCKSSGHCVPGEFRCDNGQCIAKNLTCDKSNDCGDNSDEADCMGVCSHLSCSQLCLVKSTKHRHEDTFTCKCAQDYKHKYYGNVSVCEATGPKPRLLVATDSEIRVSDLYKAEHSPQLVYATPNNSPAKITSMDSVRKDLYSVFLYWADEHSGTIERVNASAVMAGDGADLKHSVVVIGQTSIRAVACDWVSARLYWTSGGGGGMLQEPRGAVQVSTLDGRMRVQLVTQDVDTPTDIVVSPKTRQIIWSDCGAAPSIEIAGADGSSRRPLVRSNLRRPAGLAVDAPSDRLYWTDVRKETLETCLLDGSDRRVVTSFKKISGSPEMLVPWRIDVFEESVVGVSRRGLVRLDKRSGSVSTLVRNLLRLADVLVVQPVKQDAKLEDPCASQPCHVSALCLPSPAAENRTCVCPEGLVATNTKPNQQLECRIREVTVVCGLECGPGQCVRQDGGAPVCTCPPLYTGSRCQLYRCAGHCLHRGQCIPDIAPAGRTGLVPLKCVCPAGYSGARCETAVPACGALVCMNGGTCLPDGGKATCVCPIGYVGERCEQCAGLPRCQHGGWCARGAGGPVCRCLQGYKGQHCDMTVCHGYCHNEGKCTVQQNGTAKCSCPSGYRGVQCEEPVCNNSECDGHIPDGGGSMAARPQSCSALNCQNGGKCVMTRIGAVCSCRVQYAGVDCSMYVGHDGPCTTLQCGAGGVCVSQGVAGAFCACAVGARGAHCHVPDPCHNYCVNAFHCKIDENGVPRCVCREGWEGGTCAVPTLQGPAGAGGGGAWTGVGATVAVCLLGLFVGVALLLFYKRKGGKAFSHARLTDNVEITNPMYLQGGPEDEPSLDTQLHSEIDKNGSNHFANPVYDSMYAGGAAAAPSQHAVNNDERANLLEEACEEVSPTPPPPAAERTLLL